MMWWIMACGWWSSPAPDPARAAPEPEPEPEPLVVDEEAAAALAAAAALPGPGKDVWGFTLGASREAFRATCAAAGHEVDAYDWGAEPAVVRAWVEAGRASKCGGLPADPGLGEVVAVSAVFDDDHLMGITVFLQADPNAVEAALAVRYPASVAGEDQILHVVSDSAIADELLSVTLFGGAGGEHATLTFLSERGYAASPTAPPPAR